MSFQAELPFGEARLSPAAPAAPAPGIATPGHALIAGPYSAIARRLFGEILELQAADPFRRVRVAVPSHLLGVDLRRRLLRHAESTGRRGVANVRFLTLADLSREILAGREAGRPAPPSLLFAAVAAALEELPPKSPYCDARHRIGFITALTATLRDLRDAGVSGPALAEWSQRHAAPDRREALRSLAGLLSDVGRRLSPFADEVALFAAAAAEAGRRSSDERLLIYGFYDLTGLQASLLAALAAARPLSIYLPRFPGDLGDYAETAETFFERTLGVAASPAPGAAEGTRSEFFRRLALREGGPALAADGSVRLVSAADDAHEAREAAREVLIGADEGIPTASTAVLVRSDGGDSRRVLAALQRAGIPAFSLGSAEGLSTPAGRTLRLWALLEEDGYRREDVLELLDLLEDARGGSDAALFRLLASESGVVRGTGDWDAAVSRLTEASIEETEEVEPSDRLASRRPEGLRAARRLARFWPKLRDASRFSDDEQARGWGERAEDLRRRIGLLYEGAPLPPEVLAALEAVASLEATGGRVRLNVAVHTLLSELREMGAVRGRLGRDGVAVLPVMAARGLEFAHTVVTGLAERKFPALAQPDPLLFDDERASLSSATGLPLSPKTLLRPEEERFLLAAAMDTAARRLTLTTSRRDASLDRERVPSQFFDRALEALGASAEGSAHAGLRRTNLGATTREGPALTAAEMRARVLQTGGAELLAGISQPFALALARQRTRREPLFGPFEGRIDEARLRRALRDRLEKRGLSASALQNFAICPHRFFLERMLDLRAWQDPSERADIDDLTRGRLFHDAARRIAAAWKGRRFAELSGALEKSKVAQAAEESLGAFEEESGFSIAPPALRQTVRARLEGQLRAWLEFERDEGPDRRPIGAEVRFGPRLADAGDEDEQLSTDEALDIAGIPVRGRIDLLSRDADGQLHVTDFKVSRTRKRADTIRTGREKRDRLVFGGELAQLPVYALACQGPIRAAKDLPAIGAAEFLYVAPARAGGACEPISIRFDAAELLPAVKALGTFTKGALEAVERGLFLPKTESHLYKKPCETCDFAEVCGPSHERLFERKRKSDPDPAVVALFALREVP